MNRFITADEAAALIGDGVTVGLVGGGGGPMEASTVFAAIERRFLVTRHPAQLTLVHALGIGDRPRSHQESTSSATCSREWTSDR